MKATVLAAGICDYENDKGSAYAVCGLSLASPISWTVTADQGGVMRIFPTAMNTSIMMQRLHVTSVERKKQTAHLQPKGGVQRSNSCKERGWVIVLATAIEF